MKKFFKYMFISLGVVMFMMICSAIIGGVLGLKQRAAPLPDAVYLTLTLDQPLLETSVFSFNKAPSVAFTDLLITLNKAAEDARVKGLALRLNAPTITLSQIQELAPIFGKMKQADKDLTVYSESYGGMGRGNGDYLLASLFDEIWMQPTGLVFMNRAQAQIPFFKKLLNTIGITPEFERIGAYKSAPESFLFDEPTMENKETLSHILYGLETQRAEIIKKRGQLTDAQIKAAMVESPLTDKQALDMGFIDVLDYSDVFKRDVEQRAEAKQAELLPFGEYTARAKFYSKEQIKAAPIVALITAEGVIPDPTFISSVRQANLGGEAMIIPHDFEDLAEEIIENEQIKAVILRLNSPGGSPSGSETVRRALEMIQKSGKPLYVSMANVAASGGYWIALQGNVIYANQATLTGSIGVYGGKFALKEMMDKIGVNWYAQSSQNDSDTPQRFLDTPFQAMTEQDRAMLQKMMTHTYDGFLDRVSNARNIDRQKLDTEIAQGRVWLGSASKDVKLIDEIGGFLDVIARVKNDLDVNQEAPLSLIRYPKQKTAIEQVLSILEKLMSVHIDIGQWMSSLKTQINQMNSSSLVLDKTTINQ